MIDVHAAPRRHHLADFLIHIATITVGLFIAIGLEQTVEHFHHLHQRHRSKTTCATNSASICAATPWTSAGSPTSAPTLSSSSPPSPPAAPAILHHPRHRPQTPAPRTPLRALHRHLGSSETRRHHHSAPQQRDQPLQRDHPPTQSHLRRPRRLPARCLRTRKLRGALHRHSRCLRHGLSRAPPSLDAMSTADLTQYETLLATYIKAVDRIVVRVHFFDRVTRAILDGATDRDDLTAAPSRTNRLRHSPPPPLSDNPHSTAERSLREPPGARFMTQANLRKGPWDSLNK